jgi:hypothetical protein
VLLHPKWLPLKPFKIQKHVRHILEQHYADQVAGTGFAEEWGDSTTLDCFFKPYTEEMEFCFEHGDQQELAVQPTTTSLGQTSLHVTCQH